MLAGWGRELATLCHCAGWALSRRAISPKCLQHAPVQSARTVTCHHPSAPRLCAGSAAAQQVPRGGLFSNPPAYLAGNLDGKEFSTEGETVTQH